MILGNPPPNNPQAPTTPPPKCGKCGADTLEGYIPDEDHNQYTPPIWVAGKPEFGIFGGAKIAGLETHTIRTFRCTKCGFLESYALGSE